MAADGAALESGPQPLPQVLAWRRGDQFAGGLLADSGPRAGKRSGSRILREHQLGHAGRTPSPGDYVFTTICHEFYRAL